MADSSLRTVTGVRDVVFEEIGDFGASGDRPILLDSV